MNQILSDFERSDHLLLNHYLYTFINIYACARGLGGEAAAVEGEPGIGVIFNFQFSMFNGDNSRGLVVAEVDVEGGEAAGQEGAVVAKRRMLLSSASKAVLL